MHNSLFFMTRNTTYNLGCCNVIMIFTIWRKILRHITSIAHATSHEMFMLFGVNINVKSSLIEFPS